jgi:hypothetical protein
LLDSDVSVAGRHPNSEIFLDDVTVSRRHSEFRRTAQGFEMRDLGSLNGTLSAPNAVTSRPSMMAMNFLWESSTSHFLRHRLI